MVPPTRASRNVREMNGRTQRAAITKRTMWGGAQQHCRKFNPRIKPRQTLDEKELERAHLRERERQRGERQRQKSYSWWISETCFQHKVARRRSWRGNTIRQRDEHPDDGDLSNTENERKKCCKEDDERWRGDRILDTSQRKRAMRPSRRRDGIHTRVRGNRPSRGGEIAAHVRLKIIVGTYVEKSSEWLEQCVSNFYPGKYASF